MMAYSTDKFTQTWWPRQFSKRNYRPLEKLEAREDSPNLNLPQQPMMAMMATQNSAQNSANKGLSALAAFAIYSTNQSWNQISGFWDLWSLVPPNYFSTNESNLRYQPWLRVDRCHDLMRVSGRKILERCCSCCMLHYTEYRVQCTGVPRCQISLLLPSSALCFQNLGDISPTPVQVLAFKSPWLEWWILKKKFLDIHELPTYMKTSRCRQSQFYFLQQHHGGDRMRLFT